MKGTIYFAVIPEKDRKKKLEHMIAEELLRTGLKEEYGKDLDFEPRAKGEYGKPFFTLEPSIHYNISHSGKYVLCILSDQEVGIDVQEHTRVNREQMLSRMVPPEMIRPILDSDDPEKAFFAQWALREAYILHDAGSGGRLQRGRLVAASDGYRDETSRSETAGTRRQTGKQRGEDPCLTYDQKLKKEEPLRSFPTRTQEKRP